MRPNKAQTVHQIKQNIGALMIYMLLQRNVIQYAMYTTTYTIDTRMQYM